MLVGLIQLVEGLNRKSTALPQGRENSASRLPLDLKLQHQLFPRFPPVKLPTLLRLASLHNGMSKFLKISLDT